MRVRLTNPCPVSPTLTPCGDGTSACSVCPLRVHHVSRLADRDAETLLDKADRSYVCGQYFEDQHGELRLAGALRSLAAAGLLVIAGPALADGHDSLTQVQQHEVAQEMNRVRVEMEAIGLAVSDTGAVTDPSAEPGHGEIDVEQVVVIRRHAGRIRRPD